MGESVWEAQKASVGGMTEDIMQRYYALQSFAEFACWYATAFPVADETATDEAAIRARAARREVLRRAEYLFNGPSPEVV